MNRRHSLPDDDEESGGEESQLTPLLAAKRAGNINIADEESEVMELPETMAASLRQQEEKVRQVQLARKARAVIVPTNDLKVRRRLRELQEPITLFGENIPGRRERLRAILSRLILEGHTEAARIQAEEVKREEEEQSGGPVRDKAYLIQGSELLAECRHWLAQSSVAAAQARLRAERQEAQEWREAAFDFHRKAAPGAAFPEEPSEAPEALSAEEQQEAIGNYRLHRYRQLKRRMQSFFNSCSEIGDVRPLSSVDFSPDAQQLATGSWSGQCKIWDTFTLRQVCRLREQPERITDLRWHLKSPHIATSCADGVARLYRVGEYLDPATEGFATGAEFTPLAREFRGGGGSGADDSGSVSGIHNLSQPGSAEAVMGSERSRQASFPMVSPCLELAGHEDRLGRIEFHPSGRFLGTTSFDHTWRLWDLERGTCVLRQPGHARPVYTLSFQGDGSLAYSGDLGGAGHLWDLRTGRSVLALEGHSKQVVCSDFHANGWLLATGSDDNTIRMWDLRRRQCMYVIPGHTKMVSSVHWQPDSGNLADGCFLSASFDGTIKLWSSVDCSNLATLVGHESRIMRARFAPDAESIVSCSYDRTFKLWTPGFDDDDDNDDQL